MDILKNLPLPLFGNLSPAELARYERQLLLPEWGQATQERIKQTRVFVAGAGNLVAAAAFNLVAAGVGHLRVVDLERISLSDLGDQVLYRERDLGRPKALILQKRLQEANPFVDVEGLERRLSEHNVLKLTQKYDLLLADLHETKYALALNQAALKYKVPLLLGWTQEWHGYLVSIRPGVGLCLACTSLLDQIQANRGLLSPLTAIIGGVMALEALRLLSGGAAALVERLFSFNGKLCRCQDEPLPKRPSCSLCGRTPGP
ncbi:MAG: HesA/MoeB/ThiF family protein [Desulfobacca sp.]|uniref:HesA/MoeB/ThiF family protein n=1 Tax=Desulfobacca sp. TaxID=2067990 RepID=UPI00404ADB14